MPAAPGLQESQPGREGARAPGANVYQAGDLQSSARAPRHSGNSEDAAGESGATRDAGTGKLGELLLQAMDLTNQGLVVCDSFGQVVLRNARARQLVGVDEGDLLAERALQAALERALAGSAHEETLDLYVPARRTLEIKAFPLGRPEEPDGAVALVDDVSELRRLEAVRRDFVANLSHELKTPLGALSLLAETLEDEDDPEVVARLTERMGAEARRFSRIVDDLLDLSRIESGGTGTLAPVALAAVIDEATEGFFETAEARGVRLEVSPPPEDLHVLANRRDLVSAVANLVDNAIKYSEPGGPVQLAAGRVGDRAFISVRDEGIGIPKRDQERIFERFYRVDRARSRWTGGTGLGLAIVRHVAAYHGGDVSVKSVEGRGSTFVLSLPLLAPGGGQGRNHG
jgi:two-component system sensor histidine kinase SenX3